MAIDSANTLYVADTYNNTIRKVTPAGVVTTLAGQAGISGSTNGTGTNALFNLPTSVAVDTSGNVYVADSANFTIREVTSAGVVTTLAGQAGVAGSTNGTGTNALFTYPFGVTVDTNGVVYVADTDNSTIRKVTPAGVVTTFAGQVGITGSTNGTGTNAQFNLPHGVGADSAGNVYVADTDNSAIRKLTPAGVVTTFAGQPGSAGSADGTGSAARFCGSHRHGGGHEWQRLRSGFC